MRLRYIDAFKGLLIFFVIFQHVQYFSFEIRGSLLHKVFEISAMPCFFFISGYLVKPRHFDSFVSFLDYLGGKVRRLIIPSFSMLFLFILLKKQSINNFEINILDYLYEPFWGGYWFAPTLFFILLIHILVNYIRSERIETIVWSLMLILPSIIIYFTWRILPRELNIVCLRQVLEYLPCFSFGVLFSIIEKKINSIINNEFIKCISFVIPLLYLYSYCKGLFTSGYMYHEITRYFAIIYLFSFIKSKQSFLNSDSFFPNFLCYIGRNSLGIYLVHYFFIPDSLHFLNIYVQNSITIQLLFYTLIAALILICSLLTINLIKNSKWLSRLFLGD